MSFWETAMNVLSPASLFLPEKTQKAASETIADVGAVCSAPIAFGRGEESKGAFDAVDKVLENKYVDMGLEALSFIPGYGLAVDTARAGYDFSHAMNDEARGDTKSRDSHLKSSAWSTFNVALGGAAHGLAGGEKLTKGAEIVDWVTKFPTMQKMNEFPLEVISDITGTAEKPVTPAMDTGRFKMPPMCLEDPADMYID